MKKLARNFPVLAIIIAVVIFVIFLFAPLDVYDGVVSTEILEYDYKATLGQLLGLNIKPNEEIMMQNFSLNWKGLLFLITVHLVLPAVLASFIKRRFD